MYTYKSLYLVTNSEHVEVFRDLALAGAMRSNGIKHIQKTSPSTPCSADRYTSQDHRFSVAILTIGKLAFQGSGNQDSTKSLSP